MKPKIEIFKGKLRKDGKEPLWYWRLRVPLNTNKGGWETICCGGRGWRSDCYRMSEYLITIQKDMGSVTFEVFNGKDNQFYFRGLIGEQKIVLTSEGYTTASGRNNGIESIQSNLPIAEIIVL